MVHPDLHEIRSPFPRPLWADAESLWLFYTTFWEKNQCNGIVIGYSPRFTGVLSKRHVRSDQTRQVSPTNQTGLHAEDHHHCHCFHTCSGESNLLAAQDEVDACQSLSPLICQSYSPLFFRGIAIGQHQCTRPFLHP